MLIDAGVELRWSDADAAYRNPQHERLLSSTYSRSISRHATAVPADIPAIEIDVAADFERRLTTASGSGGLLVLVTEPKELANAADELRRVVDATIDFDAELIAELESITEGGKPSWATLAAADAAGELGANWANLQNVVERALNAVTTKIAATAGTLLVTNAGLLARYDRMGLVAEWRDLLHAGGTAMSSLWLLVPSRAATDVPMLDGRAVPVISRNEWSRIPPEWLSNAHRTGVAR